METDPADAGFGSARHEDSPELCHKVLCELDDENKKMAGEPALNTPWTFWFDRAPKGTNAQDYFANLKKICSVNTIKAFWCVFNNLRTVDQLKEGESYHLMRGQERRPVWEDSDNADGGRWTFHCKKDSTSTAWLELLLAAIGEGFSDHVAEGDCVVGISIKVRESEHTVFQIWNQSVAIRDQSKVMVMVKELLQGVNVALSRERYQSNQDNLVQSMMKPTHHKPSAPPPGVATTHHHHHHHDRFSSSSPQPPSPRPSLHAPQLPSVQPFSQPLQAPPPSVSTPPPPPATPLPSIDGVQHSPGGEAHPSEPSLPTPPPSGEHLLSPVPHPSSPLQGEPPFSMATIQPPLLGEIPSGSLVWVASSEVGALPAPRLGVTAAPCVGVTGLLPTPHQFRHPHEGFRYRHPPLPMQRFPGPYGNQSHSLLGPRP